MTIPRAVFSPRRGACRAAQGSLPSPEPPICPTHVSICLDLPIPPSLNGAYKNVPGRGRVSTAKLKAWKDEAGWLVKLARCGSIVGAYRFTILLPLEMRGDVDNRIKAASDLLVKQGVTSDDHQAVSTRSERSGNIDKGRCRLIVESVA